MLQLDPDQTAFIRNISDDSVGIKDVIVAGKYNELSCIKKLFQKFNFNFLNRSPWEWKNHVIS